MHKNYEKLSPEEKAWVNSTIEAMFITGGIFDLKLANDDRCERVVEALATWLITSKEKKEK